MAEKNQLEITDIELAKEAILNILPDGPEWMPKLELVRLLEKVRPPLTQRALIFARDDLIKEQAIVDISGQVRRIIYYDPA